MTRPLALMKVDEIFQLFTMECDRPAFSNVVRAWTDAGLVVRVVRGHKMPTWPQLFDEFAAAWQFPLYFGDNLDAFEDCLTDLSWLPPKEGYVIAITRPNDVLRDAEAGALQTFAAMLRDAAAEWAVPVTEGEWWDRDPVPLHVILHYEENPVSSLWTNAGIPVVPYPT